MGLSQYEQQVLDLIEQAETRQDPRLAAKLAHMGRRPAAPRPRRTARAARPKRPSNPWTAAPARVQAGSCFITLVGTFLATVLWTAGHPNANFNQIMIWFAAFCLTFLIGTFAVLYNLDQAHKAGEQRIWVSILNASLALVITVCLIILLFIANP